MRPPALVDGVLDHRSHAGSPVPGRSGERRAARPAGAPLGGLTCCATRRPDMAWAVEHVVEGEVGPGRSTPCRAAAPVASGGAGLPAGQPATRQLVPAPARGAMGWRSSPAPSRPDQARRPVACSRACRSPASSSPSTRSAAPACASTASRRAPAVRRYGAAVGRAAQAHRHRRASSGLRYDQATPPARRIDAGTVGQPQGAIGVRQPSAPPGNCPRPTATVCDTTPDGLR